MPNRLHIIHKGSIQETYRYYNMEDWSLLLFTSLPYVNSSYIKHWDIRKVLPFEDESFEVIYSFHTLNHLSEVEGGDFLKEIKRILKKGGRGRIVVPDLYFNVTNYLQELEEYKQSPDKQQFIRYEWAALTLLDQVVRSKPGGEMLKRIKERQVDKAQVAMLNGDWFDDVGTSIFLDAQRTLYSTHRRFLLEMWYGFRRKLQVWLLPHKILELHSENWKSYYDDITLQEKLENVGFEKIEVLDYKTSYIENWPKYNFDCSKQADRPLEPSVYIEFIKP